MWEEIIAQANQSIDEILEIIDDALCFGYEFKVKNHKILFREKSDID